MDDYNRRVTGLTGYRRLREVAGDWARELVVESGIDPDVALERGYHATASAERLEAMGFTVAQRRVPALVIPMHSPDGATVAYQIKPRDPRRGIKYESPSGSRVVIDLHPRMQDAALDPHTDLFITEGMKKADALTSRGLCTMGLVGVWNWAVSKTRCEVPLPDWDYVPLDAWAWHQRALAANDPDVSLRAIAEARRVLGELRQTAALLFGRRDIRDLEERLDALEEQNEVDERRRKHGLYR